jgi:cobalamin biosynthesis Mg chelatase CobN
MDFEHCIRQFLGDEAYHIADSANNDIEARKWLRKCVKVMRKRVDVLDTTTRHKKMLMREINEINERLKQANALENKEMVISLFWLVSRLFGFDVISGRVINEPFYFQNYQNYIREKIAWDKNKNFWQTIEEEKKNTISVRKALYKQLKSDGLSDNQIAQIFNTTEYQLKKLKNDI